ncbi:hypothetical protein HOK51_10110 [Candidatus Woesearchaeota archaeon]|jgi:hypothetical protein|nr:hypothetical protein [Candidatus Woesearchaeota archaeon]MBT6520178.1 hypothetical protein [Candidatus Woesearchaeota archaeon]MBT7367196.1 hypothetical protein [Candidatus Woesearchaeota archaeon]
MKYFFSSNFVNKNKKAQGLSLNVIIIAVLALIVLVILVMALTGKMSVFNRGASDCVSKGGTCKPVTVGCNSFEQPLLGTNCAKLEPSQQCCLKMEADPNPK